MCNWTPHNQPPDLYLTIQQSRSPEEAAAYLADECRKKDKAILAIDTERKNRNFAGMASEELEHYSKRAVDAEAALCRARDLLTKMRDACKSEPTMNNRKYDGLGIEVNRFLGESAPCRHEAEVEPGQLIAEIGCPACGAELRVEHGDDEGEIGVLTR